jgi:hypothetical protein
LKLLTEDIVWPTIKLPVLIKTGYGKPTLKIEAQPILNFHYEESKFKIRQREGNAD